MKRTVEIILLSLLAAPFPLAADSTIDPVDKFGYGANIGWINFRHDQPAAPEGVVVGAAFLSGFAYSANCGWINLGDGSPGDGVAYSNASGSDFGVNHDGTGILTGLAYGANIGWISFEQTHGKPRVDLATGEFSGFAYSANCGWINLGTGDLVTNSLAAGPDTDGDMIPDAWELEQGAANGTPNNLGLLNKPGDADGDGVSDLDEYHADSNPFDASSYLRITRLELLDTPGDNIELDWTSSDRRVYDVQKSADLVVPFADFAGKTGIPGQAVTTSTALTDPQTIHNFYRIEAKLPLAP
ncbi:MAG: hypothetical protein HKN82_00155 [Akkermansiaceae bacterium]|nr:hypothetical protein [Akkermansiaceae bacterium]NNM29530.1 hypothetical protein [Akkermansiaceae bacterium]